MPASHVATSFFAGLHSLLLLWTKIPPMLTQVTKQLCLFVCFFMVAHERASSFSINVFVANISLLLIVVSATALVDAQAPSLVVFTLRLSPT